MIDNALNVQQRLMRHTKYDKASGCLEWVGSKRNGYGRMIIGSRTEFQTLADRYGVSKRTMQNAIKGVTWKCVPYMPEPPQEV